MNYVICCDFRSIMRNRRISEALKGSVHMYLILFEKGENIKTPLPCTAYFKINNNLDNRGLRLPLKILKQLLIIAVEPSTDYQI